MYTNTSVKSLSFAVTVSTLCTTNKHSGLQPYMERGHERSNSHKTLKICLGKHLSMESKDN